MTHREVTDGLRTDRLVLETKGSRYIEFAVRPIRAQLAVLGSLPKWEVVRDLIAPRAQEARRQKTAVITLRRALKTIAQSVGFDPATIYLHLMRRTYATQFLAATKGDPRSLPQLMKAMGWQSMQVALTYVDAVDLGEIDEVDKKLRRS